MGSRNEILTLKVDPYVFTTGSYVLLCPICSLYAVGLKVQVPIRNKVVRLFKVRNPPLKVGSGVEGHKYINERQKSNPPFQMLRVVRQNLCRLVIYRSYSSYYIVL